MMVSLRSQINLVMAVKRARDYPAPAPAAWKVMDCDIEALTVALHKALSNVAEDGRSGTSVGSTSLRLIKEMAVKNPVDLNRLEVRVDLPSGQIEVMPPNDPIEDRVHFHGTEDSLLVVSWDKDTAWGVAHLVKMPVKQVHASVSGSDIRFITPSFKALLATVIGRQRWHIEVIPEMDHNIGLFLGDVPSSPFQMV